MATTALAHTQIQALLGIGAVDDSLWYELLLFETTALPLVIQLWQLDTYDTPPALPPRPGIGEDGRTDEATTLHARRLTAARYDLQAALGRTAASQSAAAFLLHPQLWQPPYLRRLHEPPGLSGEHEPGHAMRQTQARLLEDLALQIVQRQPPPDWTAQICQRIVTLCSAALPADAPTLADCVAALLACEDAGTSALLDALTIGDWHTAWQSAVLLGGWFDVTVADPVAVERLRCQWQVEGPGCVLALLVRHFAHQRLDAHTIRHLLQALPHSLAVIQGWLAAPTANPPPGARLLFVPALRLPEQAEERAAFAAALETLIDLALRDLLADVRPEARATLLQLDYLGGGAYLLRLAQDVRQRGLTSLAAPALVRQDSAAVLQHLLKVLHRRADDDSSHLVARLRQMGAPTLLALLPYTPAYEPELCAALDWPGSAELLRLLRLLQEDHPTDEATSQLRQHLRRMQPAHAQGLLDTLRPSLPAAVALAQTALDQQRAAAASVGSGDAEATGLGLEAASLGRQWQIAGYTLTLVLRDGTAVAEVRNGRRTLKRVPAPVSAAAAYQEVVAALNMLQGQEQQCRRRLLERMRSGQPFSATERAQLGPDSLVGGMLENLIVTDAAGAFGLFRASDDSLEGLHGERVRIGGPLTIAHPATLDQAGILAAWQTELVRRRIVQPFRQVFRELYRVTPAEATARYESWRLVGRRLPDTAAVALLARLGWQVEDPAKRSARGYTVRKPFSDQGCVACITLDGPETTRRTSAGAPGEQQATVGMLNFWPLAGHSARQPAHSPDARLLLTEVPPLLFSEVLRDLDMATVAPHEQDEHGASWEVLQRRGDLVRATAKALGLTGAVAVADPIVRIRGTLTAYRVHLATGAVCTEAGHYIALALDSKMRKAVHIPFRAGDPDDPDEPGDAASTSPVSEIVGRVLLLANDTSITDRATLAQIRQASQRAV